MIEVKIILNNCLKKGTNITDLRFVKEPISIKELLNNANIGFENIGIIKIGDSIVDKNFIILESRDVRLFRIIAGG